MRAQEENVFRTHLFKLNQRGRGLCKIFDESKHKQNDEKMKNVARVQNYKLKTLF